MAIELKVPQVGESITEVEIGDWLKSAGDPVRRDETLVVIETDKATVELPAPADGTLGQILKPKGQKAAVGEVIGYLEEGAPPPKARAERPLEQPSPPVPPTEPAAPRPAPASSPPKPAAPPPTPAPAAEPPAAVRAEPGPAPAAAPAKPAATSRGREEEVVPMTLLRRRTAERLVQAQQAAALLTTFNEIDMSAAAALRQQCQPKFQERYGVKLGWMSFFVKAAVDALKLVPPVNAEVRGTDLVYRNYYDIGIAIGMEAGLVVPVLRDADGLSFAEIERAIDDFAGRARQHKLKPDELQGGTFTITNGGIFGSLLSTPIVNPPQSGILGLHAIQDRPVARGGQVVIRPMMYVALTYDHRVVDGREAVTFLKRIKDCLENPSRMLLEV